MERLTLFAAMAVLSATLGVLSACLPVQAAARSAGASPRPLVPPYSREVVVLTYHHIAEQAAGEGPASISLAHFAEQLGFLKQDGFHVVPLSAIGGFLRGTAELPPKAVCITFDDGYQSYASAAVPTLVEFGYPSTCFVIGSAVGVKPLPGHLPHMSWQDMGKLLKTGLVSFGSHTYNLHGTLPGSTDAAPITQLSGRLAAGGKVEDEPHYASRVTADLVESRDVMSRELGKTPSSLAYPYGARNPALVRLVGEVGFALAFTTDSGAIRRGLPPLELPRLNAGSAGVSVAYLAQRISALTH